MTAIILVWDPDEWNDWTYPAVVEEVAETGRFLATWEVGSSDAGFGPRAVPRRAVCGDVAAGDSVAGDSEVGSQADAASSGAEAWLVIQSRYGSGLIGHGVIVSETPAPRLSTPGTGTAGARPAAAPARSPVYVRVAFDALLPAGDQIPPGVLKEAVPGIDWDALNGSATRRRPVRRVPAPRSLERVRPAAAR